jgi:hypothetical protein
MALLSSAKAHRLINAVSGEVKCYIKWTVTRLNIADCEPRNFEPIAIGAVRRDGGFCPGFRGPRRDRELRLHDSPK